MNINPSRTGILKILNKMGVKIDLKNTTIYKGEKIADLIVKGKIHLNQLTVQPN